MGAEAAKLYEQYAEAQGQGGSDVSGIINMLAKG
jgi:3-hydroxyisobutyrate dehydrogenase